MQVTQHLYQLAKVHQLLYLQVKVLQLYLSKHQMVEPIMHLYQQMLAKVHQQVQANHRLYQLAKVLQLL